MAASSGVGFAWPRPLHKQCSCKNSKCLKLYCECFAAKSYCIDCHCKDCHNTPAFESDREAAAAAIELRNPEAFQPKISTSQALAAIPQRDESWSRKVHHRGCRCKNSQCLKKYCECFQAGIFCSENCKCIGCKNFQGSAPRVRIDKEKRDQASILSPLFLLSAASPAQDHQRAAASTTTIAATAEAVAATKRYRNEAFETSPYAPSATPHKSRRAAMPIFAGLLEDETIEALGRVLLESTREQEQLANDQAASDLLCLFKEKTADADTGNGGSGGKPTTARTTSTPVHVGPSPPTKKRKKRRTQEEEDDDSGLLCTEVLPIPYRSSQLFENQEEIVLKRAAEFFRDLISKSQRTTL